VKHAATREQQNQAQRRPRAKCDISLAQLDALYFSYVNPVGRLPARFANAAGKLQLEHRPR